MTQHMPPVFTQLFAQRLDTRSKLHVSEAKPGDAVVPGHLLIAPGDFHMRLAQHGNGLVVELDHGPKRTTAGRRSTRCFDPSRSCTAAARSRSS